ncbi:MAG: FliI/YscN family ATPase [Deltaproteobacteria bacterium]|nr:FliI/YscN family ATPase [Deltaproteobacteria bacterium]
MPFPCDFGALADAVERCVVPEVRGKVTATGELWLEAVLPGARVGAQAFVERRGLGSLVAEVAWCNGSLARLVPLDPGEGAAVGDTVVLGPAAGAFPCGPDLFGRVVDPLGRPLDGGPALAGVTPFPLCRKAPGPLARRPVTEQLVTGVRAIDGCLAIGVGQRIGLFAGPGLGKSTLLGTLARARHEGPSVVCLVGERGREVGEFVERILTRDGLARSVVIVATADSPPALRARALSAATACAEWFRARGEHVLLLVDSLTRAARARRDVALALGEPPVRGGYPASTFSFLPGLLERAGCDGLGSITGVYAVLTEGDGDDPLAEEARSLLDGHIALSQKLARTGRWPAVDLVRSVSRVMERVVPKDQLAAARALARILGAYEENEDLVLMGAYRRGASRDTDLALARKDAIEIFLRQGTHETSSLAQTRERLAALVAGA